MDFGNFWRSRSSNRYETRLKIVHDHELCQLKSIKKYRHVSAYEKDCLKIWQQIRNYWKIPGITHAYYDSCLVRRHLIRKKIDFFSIFSEFFWFFPIFLDLFGFFPDIFSHVTTFVSKRFLYLQPFLNKLRTEAPGRTRNRKDTHH